MFIKENLYAVIDDIKYTSIYEENQRNESRYVFFEYEIFNFFLIGRILKCVIYEEKLADEIASEIENLLIRCLH